MDIARAFEEAKSLPDQVLQRELNSPTGSIPGYIILSELAERDVMRKSAGGQPTMTLAQKYAVPRYSAGGVVQSYTPLSTFIDALTSPEINGSLQQEKLNEKFRGLPPLQAPNAPGVPQQAPSLTSFIPRQPVALKGVSPTGGVTELLRRGR